MRQKKVIQGTKHIICIRMPPGIHVITIEYPNESCLTSHLAFSLTVRQV